MHTQSQTASRTRSGYRQATYWLGVIIIGLTVGLGMQFAHAWTNPTGAPPTQTISGPLTTSADAQYKAGGLALGNGLSVSNAAGAYSALFMVDDESPNGGKYIHANSNSIGFTNGALNAWLSRWDNDGNHYTVGKLATNNYDVNCPNGWSCGVHTWDVYAEGSILSAHDLVVKGNAVYVGNNGNYFYGDGWNTAARQNGEFYVQHQNGSAANIVVNDTIANGWTYAQLFMDTNDNGYYMDPNGTARLNYVDANSATLRGGLLDLTNSGSRVWGNGWDAKVGVNGEFSVTDPNGNGFKNMKVNDVYLNSIGRWASSLGGGATFGGMYDACSSPGVRCAPNPLTGGYYCPSGFTGTVFSGFDDRGEVMHAFVFCWKQ